MQPGGSQYGAPPPDMNPFASGAGTPRSRADHHVLGGPASETSAQPPLVEAAASPVSSRAPPRGSSSLVELAPAGVPPPSAGFPDDDALAAAGEEADRGGTPGNRWPRQETLALLKIRSEMDAAFRDATLKAPLWEDVSRKLAELGYKRSAKKCKEKFENVHKYYKRTKDGRAGRQDGKSYRFFSQLEALHSSSGGGGASTAPAAPVPATSGGTPNAVPSSIGMVGSSTGNLNPTPLNVIPLAVGTAPTRVQAPDPMAGAGPGPSIGISFSATSSSSASESEEDTEEGLTGEPRKRKRRAGGGGGGTSKMMAFFEELMGQVMERQEAMQQRFLEAIEKREQDRMIREEAWKRQEVARLAREHEMMAQERAMAASRDAAIVAFLQKMTGQTPAQQHPPPAQPPAQQHLPPAQPPSQQHPPPAPVSPPPPEQTRPPPPQRSQSQQPQQITPVRSTQQISALEIVPVMSEATEVVSTSAGGGVGVGGSGDPASSSRWPKSEVHDLIKLRTELESRYQEAGPKGPLWEEISAMMQRLGYNRSSKRCKEKWENINKYFKKVKESNKKRPEDSKTCPYFHELDAIYRKKLGGGGGGGVGSIKQQEPMTGADIVPHPQLLPPPQSETEGKSDTGNTGGNSNGGGGGNASGNGGPSSAAAAVAAAQKAQTSNGGLKPAGAFEEGMGGGTGSTKKPEDIAKELMANQQQQQQQRRQHHQPMMVDYDKPEELEGEDVDTEQDGDEDDDDEDDGEMEYRIHYQQRAGVVVNGAANGRVKELAPAPAGSFMAMMQ